MKKRQSRQLIRFAEGNIIDFESLQDDAIFRFYKYKEYKYECLAILLGLDTGLRASDLLNLKTDSISYNELENRYECISDIKKTGVKNHKRLIHLKTYEMFKSLNLPDGYIFTNPKTGKLFTRVWLNKRMKIRYHLTFQILRKISAKRILKHYTIEDAQKHLGHKRISTTIKYLNTSGDKIDGLKKIHWLYN